MNYEVLTIETISKLAEIDKTKRENQQLKKELKAYENIFNELIYICQKDYYKKNTRDIDSIVISNNLEVKMYLKLKELWKKYN